jgi:hypothetical protein
MHPGPEQSTWETFFGTVTSLPVISESITPLEDEAISSRSMIDGPGIDSGGGAFSWLVHPGIRTNARKSIIIRTCVERIIQYLYLLFSL